MVEELWRFGFLTTSELYDMGAEIPTFTHDQAIENFNTYDLRKHPAINFPSGFKYQGAAVDAVKKFRKHLAENHRSGSSILGYKLSPNLGTISSDLFNRDLLESVRTSMNSWSKFAAITTSPAAAGRGVTKMASHLGKGVGNFSSDVSSAVAHALSKNSSPSANIENIQARHGVNGAANLVNMIHDQGTFGIAGAVVDHVQDTVNNGTPYEISQMIGVEALLLPTLFLGGQAHSVKAANVTAKTSRASKVMSAVKRVASNEIANQRAFFQGARDMLVEVREVLAVRPRKRLAVAGGGALDDGLYAMAVPEEAGPVVGTGTGSAVRVTHHKVTRFVLRDAERRALPYPARKFVECLESGLKIADDMWLRGVRTEELKLIIKKLPEVIEAVAKANEDIEILHRGLMRVIRDIEGKLRSRVSQMGLGDDVLSYQRIPDYRVWKLVTDLEKRLAKVDWWGQLYKEAFVIGGAAAVLGAIIFPPLAALHKDLMEEDEAAKSAKPEGNDAGLDAGVIIPPLKKRDTGGFTIPPLKEEHY